ncbi:metalloregulator ArsR/SmtB family transcription factor [Parasphingopyxis sp.]|uniref:metalloregulator ArsR/SmtB family transcription factor n=1 Tax=Parasphingopyxis sp. TaxID=1920299 RepID=UPI00260A167E|nr:metalloregulator ArsR/SmtB family transcription factor [Parasphingopyxis sp.]
MQDCFKALSHPIRRAVLAQLRKGDATAGMLAEQFDVSAPTMSRHFQVLKDAGLILAERRGTEIVYSFNASVAEEMVGVVAALLAGRNADAVTGRERAR